MARSRRGHGGAVRLAAAAALAAGTWSAGASAAATLTTLYAFSGADGTGSMAPPVPDGKGNLYGTTSSGGVANRGEVFELSPPTSGGAWIFTVLHGFSGTKDGADSLAALTIGANGTLYGTTYEGGLYDQGMAFAVVPASAREQYLVSFGGSNYYGYWPTGGLLIGAHNVLYGTTSYGGGGQAGLVFALQPPTGAGQPWTEQPIYDFGSYGSGDAYSPRSGLASDGTNLYGVAISGGQHGNGAVFALMPTGSGGWTESVIYSFGAQANDGALPQGGMLIANGTIYGTTSQGGPAGAGTVFKLTQSQGVWSETILYSFANNNADGVGPQGALAIDAAGKLYGTTPFGGAHGYGTVFRLSPKATAPWTETVLHSFTASTDGASPYSGLIAGPGGVYYGTTSAGGAAGDVRWGYGTVFQIVP